MQTIRRLAHFVVLIAALAATGCANKTRTLAVAGYQTSQTAHALQTAAETAHASGTLSTPDFKNFLTAQDKVADAGIVYSKALIAYIAAKDSGTATELAAALAALVAGFNALPEAVSNAVFKARIQAETAKAAPAIANAKKAGAQ